MITRKITALILSALLLLAVMAGCASDDPPAAATPTPDNSGSGNTTQDPANDIPPPAGISGNIVYWSMWNETEPQADVIKAAVANFTSANPDASVTIEWKGRDVRTLIFPALEGGTQIDLFDSDPMYMYGSDPGKLKDISAFYSSTSVDGSRTMADMILGGLVEWDKSMANQAGLPGNHYTIPYAPYVVSFFYNKDLFDQAGITSMPQTWAELGDACEKLLAIGVEPITAESNAYYDMIFAYILVRYFGEDGCIALAEGKDNGWDQPGVLAALEILEDFAAKGYFSKGLETNQYPQGQDDLSLGNVAMYLNGSWLPSEQAEIAGPDFRWGQFAIPEVPGGKTGINDNTVGGQAFAVSASSQNEEAVYEFLKHIFSTPVQQMFPEFDGVPAIVTVDWPAAVGDQKAIVEKLQVNVSWAGQFGGDFVNGVVNPEIMNLMLGKQSAADTLANITK